jgi:hypothetical protein
VILSAPVDEPPLELLLELEDELLVEEEPPDEELLVLEDEVTPDEEEPPLLEDEVLLAELEPELTGLPVPPPQAVTTRQERAASRLSRAVTVCIGALYSGKSRIAENVAIEGLTFPDGRHNFARWRKYSALITVAPRPHRIQMGVIP